MRSARTLTAVVALPLALACASTQPEGTDASLEFEEVSVYHEICAEVWAEKRADRSLTPAERARWRAAIEKECNR